MSLLEIKKDRLLLDGEPFFLVSGDIHYFRILPGGWRRRLELMKDFGLTAIQTYVPWNAHEPRPGVYDFSGMLDLAAFLRLCGEIGLKVLLRPSCYICSEWDMGGLPSWLLRDPGICLRSSDPAFLEPMTRYMKRLCAEFLPCLSTNGGPVIAVCVENEYGSYANDREYLNIQTELLKQCGVDVPLYVTDGYGKDMLENGSPSDPSVWHGANYRIESRTAIAALRAWQPDKPPLIGEYWSGRSMHWEDEFHHREPEPAAKGFRQALDLGACVNFYMFAGGTNFGFMHGANYGRLCIDGPEAVDRYISGMTSYDADALISENGVPTDKYYACRRELDEFLGKPVRPVVHPAYKTQCPAPVHAEEEYRLMDNLDVLTKREAHRANVCSMEQLDQDYGFILYTTQLNYIDDGERELFIDGLADRALVYVDGRYKGVLMRGKDSLHVRFTVRKGGSRLDLLVENMGRINFGRFLDDRKGITGCVRLNCGGAGILMNWTIRTLPLDDLSALHKGSAVSDSPVFYRASFSAKPGIDTFADMADWHKGCVWINGFHLGRYWNAGPQQALYLPGELLKEHNEICILELHPEGTPPEIRFRDTPALTGNLTDKPVHVYKAEE